MRVNPEQFTSSSPPPRIIGTEVEYCAAGGMRKTEMIADDENARLMRLGGDFLENGGKEYVDLGMTEFASPESLGPAEAAQYKVGGHRHLRSKYKLHPDTLCDTTAYINMHPQHSKEDKGIKTTGYHENYITPNDNMDRKLKDLASMLVVRPLFTGTGLVQKNGGYACSGKGLALSGTFGIGMTRDMKPMIRTPEHTDAHATSEWARVEVRSGDSPQLPWANFMSLALGSLSLRLSEHGLFPGNLHIDTPSVQLRNISLSPDGNSKVKLGHGATIEANDWFIELLDALYRLEQKIDLPEDETIAIKQLEEACGHVQKDMDALGNRVDHVAKRFILERSKNRSIQGAMKLQAMWGSVEQSGMANKLIDSGVAQGFGDIGLPIIDPVHPPRSRAALRVSEMKKQGLNALQGSGSVDWHRVGVIDLFDPYDTGMEPVLS